MFKLEVRSFCYDWVMAKRVADLRSIEEIYASELLVPIENPFSVHPGCIDPRLVLASEEAADFRYPRIPGGSPVFGVAAWVVNPDLSSPQDQPGQTIENTLTKLSEGAILL
jgi:hypothetical protein